MKLRNKKTGEVTEGAVWLETSFHREARHCASIAELNEHWEDFKEPLIKDEKVRKAVRAWAEANGITQVGHDACWNAFRCTDFVIAFDYDFDRHDDLKDRESYTIAELCGEDEE